MLAVTNASCAPRGKTYGPVADAARAEQVARAVLPGETGPFQTRRQGDTWFVEAHRASGWATVEIDARTGRVRSYVDEVVDVDLIKPLPPPPARAEQARP
jgi:hypothetical protein